jgi:cobalt/nickel transport protein
MKQVLSCALALGLFAWLSCPLWLGTKGEFSGSDGLARQAISDQQPSYKPWFQPFWAPSSAEIESGLFALQAALGAGLLGYVVGYLDGKRGRT